MTVPEPVVLFLAWSGLVAWTWAVVWFISRWRLGYRILETRDTEPSREIDYP